MSLKGKTVKLKNEPLQLNYEILFKNRKIIKFSEMGLIAPKKFPMSQILELPIVSGTRYRNPCFLNNNSMFVSCSNK